MNQKQALWTILAIALIPIAIFMARQIANDVQRCAVEGAAGKFRWCLTSETIQREEDPFGFWVAIGFNICVLILVTATIIAATATAILGQE
jgi:hypothetical protein